MSPETMLHLVAYDIPGDKLRTRLHKLLGCYGLWTQFSLFECHLTQKQAIKLVGEIKSLVTGENGHVRIYMLSRDDVERTVTLGGAPPQEDTIFLV